MVRCYASKIVNFQFLHRQQQVLSVAAAQAVLGLKATFWLPFSSSVYLCRPACFCSSYIHLQKRSFRCLPHHSFSSTPNHPPTLSSPFLFSPGTGLISGLRVQKRIEGENTGEHWKEGGDMKGRSWREQEEGREQGRGGQVRENAREWSNDLAAPAIVKGRKGGVQRHEKRKKEWEGKIEGVLINMASGRSAIPLILSPTLYHFLHQLPTHKTLIFQTNCAEKRIQNRG